MPYLFSVFKDESPEDLDEALCYYINMTDETQIIRAIYQEICYLESLIFPEERILFTTLLDSYLEVKSPTQEGGNISKIDCKLLYLH